LNVDARFGSVAVAAGGLSGLFRRERAAHSSRFSP